MSGRNSLAESAEAIQIRHKNKQILSLSSGKVADMVIRISLCSLDTIEFLIKRVWLSAKYMSPLYRLCLP